jgi:flagellar motor switch protein FliN/FliY
MEKIRITAVEKTVSNSIIETFETMLSMELVKVGKMTDPGLNDRRLVGAVNYAGEVVGVMSLHVSSDFAGLITSVMLGIEQDQLDGLEEIKDVLGEITNIVSGNLKSDFLDADLACVISTPSITRGSDFKIEPSRIGPIHQWIFRHKEHEILIEIALKEDIGARTDITGMAKLSSDELRKKINSVDVPTNIINAVIDVFYTMLNMEVETIPEVPANFREEMRTVGSVTFAGDVHGVFIIQVNDDFARKMTAAMIGMEEDEIESEEEVFDVIRELSNIIGGNLKSSFVDVGLSCALSTPSITNGRDFRVESLNIIKTQRFLFNAQGNTVIVDAGIKRDEEKEGEAGVEGGEAGVADANQALAQQKEVEDELRNLKLLLGIPLELTIQLGRTKKRIQDILKLGKGSVVELTELEGEPVDILVNETLIAKGEVLVDKEKYGVRIVEVVSRKERVASLT